jgi:hypothetical protein
MTETELAAYIAGALITCYFVGVQWGKYARILKDLGNSA